MNYPKAIVIAAVMIAVAIVFSTHLQARPSFVAGNYQIATVRPDSEFPAVWVVDTRSGDLTFCIGMPGARGPNFIGVNCFDKKGKMLSGSWGDMKTK